MHIYKSLLKRSKPHPERRAIAKHFHCSNTLSLLIKLEKLMQISVLISVQLRPIQRWEVCDKSKIWARLRTFWTNFGHPQNKQNKRHSYIFIHIYRKPCKNLQINFSFLILLCYILFYWKSFCLSMCVCMCIYLWECLGAHKNLMHI